MPDQKKSTDEGVTVGDAEKAMADIKTIEELEAYAGQEAASDDGREGVKKAFSKRKAEIEEAAFSDKEETADPEPKEQQKAQASGEQEKSDEEETTEEEEETILKVPRKDLDSIKTLIDIRLKAAAEVRSKNAKLSPVDQALTEAAELIGETAKGKGKHAEIAESDLVGAYKAVLHKVNEDQRRRGMQQPAKSDRALMDAEQALLEMGKEAG